jgi:hypothetical protein
MFSILAQNIYTSNVHVNFLFFPPPFKKNDHHSFYFLLIIITYTTHTPHFLSFFFVFFYFLKIIIRRRYIGIITYLLFNYIPVTTNKQQKEMSKLIKILKYRRPYAEQLAQIHSFFPLIIIRIPHILIL